MNNHLAHLILDYQTSVAEAARLLQRSGIKLPRTNMEWACLKIPSRGRLEGGIPYLKHGFGCLVELPCGAVDFDFGKNGEIDGFDAWRLMCFADVRLAAYGFNSDVELHECFEAEIQAGHLVYSGYILYYLRKFSELSLLT